MGFSCYDENDFLVFEFRINVWVEAESNFVTEVEFCHFGRR